MKTHLRAGSCLCGLALLLLSTSSVDADPEPGDSAALVRVGSTALSSADVLQRYAQVPEFQRATLGQSRDQQKLAFVDEVLVPELLLSQQAQARKLHEKPELRWQSQQLLARALEEQMRAEVEAALSADDVRAYFDQHQKELARPRAIRLYRLLTKDRAAAEKLLERAKSITDMADWRQLVREHSVDKATKLRDGDLGFVQADGNTTVPRVRVSKVLFEAAEKVDDGQLVDHVLPDEGHFAVVWRRGSLDAVEPSFEVEAPRIRQRLVEQAVHQKLEALVKKLAQGKVTRENPELLEELNVTTPPDPRLPGSAFLLPPAPPRPARPAASHGTNR